MSGLPLPGQAPPLTIIIATQWLDTAWGGNTWLPTDLREGLAAFGLAEPAAGVTASLKDITRLAQCDSLVLSSLWCDGGLLRDAVSRDLQERIAKPKTARTRGLKPHLTAAIAKSVLAALRQSTPSIDQDAGCQDLHSSPPDATMSVAPGESHMDVDSNSNSNSNKRPASPDALSSIRGDKRLRTAAFTAADTIVDALSTNSTMSGPVIHILGRRLTAGPASLCWIDPIHVQADEASHPRQLESLSLGRSVAVAILTSLPCEHWCFAVLEQVGQAIHLRLHDCQPSAGRLGLIKSRFEAWISTSEQLSSVQVTAETCPHLHGANWSSGLHALSCFRRALQGTNCSSHTPFVAADEQKMHLDLVRKAIPSTLTNEECTIIAAVQARQDDRDLINKPMEELDQQRAQLKAVMRAKASGRI
ncbi:hypothetical protein ACHAPU_009044 [Fusarium lateritium]